MHTPHVHAAMCVQGFKRRETNRQTDERTGAEGPSSDREQRRKVDKSERNRRGEAVGKYREREKKKERKKGEGEKGDRIQGTEKERTTMFRSGEIRCWFVFEATYTGFLRTSEPRRSYLHSHRHLHRCRRRRERCIRYTLTEEQPVAPTEQKRLRGRVNAFQMHNCVCDVPTQSHHKMEYAIKQ